MSGIPIYFLIFLLENFCDVCCLGFSPTKHCFVIGVGSEPQLASPDFLTMGNAVRRNVNTEAVDKDLAKELLTQENVSFNEKDLELLKAQHPDTAQDYINGLMYTTRMTTVPQIFICGEFVGGFTELKRLVEEKKLFPKLEKCTR